MNDHTEPFEQSEEDILSFDVSDEALEAAARTIPGAAMSFPNAPTVNIVVVCCGDYRISGPPASSATRMQKVDYF